jgi:hypothetical protein
MKLQVDLVLACAKRFVSALSLAVRPSEEMDSLCNHEQLDAEKEKKAERSNE